MSKTITVKYENDEGDEIELELPSKKEVCYECDGEGFVLIDGLRHEAFTMEEFEEAFDDDEDRQAYFTRGSKYDQQCPQCKGQNVVDVVDEQYIPEELKAQYKEYQAYREEQDQADAEYDAMCAAERRMGC